MEELTGTDEELELAFVDDTELLDANADAELRALVEEEDEDLEDEDGLLCLIAKALSGTLEVAVIVLVEFFRLQ